MKKSIKFYVSAASLLVLMMLLNSLPVYALSAPTMTATVATTSQIDLSWNSVEGAESYELWRKLNNNTYFEVVAKPANPYYTDAVQPNNKYTYKVVAIAGSSYSNSSNNVTVYTDLVGPSTPTNLSATSDLNHVNLSWQASRDNWGIEKYNIYGRSENQPFSFIGSSVSNYFTHNNLPPNTTYYYYITAVDRAQYESGTSNEVSVQTLADTAAPTIPSELTAKVVSDTRIDLSWTASIDNLRVVRYAVYRSAANTDNNYTEFSTTSTGYSFTNLSKSSRYYFKVKAVDAANNHSAWSPAVSATTLSDIEKPTSPLIWAQALSTNTVRITWSGGSDNVEITDYEIYRSNGLTFNKIGSSTTSSYLDTVSENSFWQYQVKSKDAAGNLSDPSNTVSVKSNGDTQPPSKPNNLRVTNSTGDEATLAWDASNDDLLIRGYNVYRAVGNGSFSRTTTTTGTSFIDISLSSNATYKYYIKAFDEAGNESTASDTTTIYPSSNTDRTVSPESSATLTISDLAELKVPKDALSVSAQYKINTKTFSSYTNTGYKTLAQPIEVSVKDGNNNVTALSKQLTLAIYYTSSERGSLSTSSMGIYYWNASSWVPVSSSVSSGKVTAEISTPGVFALLADNVTPVPTLSSASTSKVQQVYLTGSAEKNSRVEIMFNGITDTVTATASGTFSHPVTLVKGNNEIKMRATDSAGNQSNWSKVYTIIFNPEPTLTDIEAHWAKNNIKRAIQSKITSGYSDQTFRPNRTVTRAEFCSFVVSALGYQPVISPNLKFKDSSSIPDWARGFVAKAVETGLISGYSDSSFKPNRQITRQEMASIIVRAMSLENEVVSKQNERLGFRDAAQIRGWAKGSVMVAVERRVIKGYEDNTFKPNKSATRAEAVTMILNMVDNKQSASESYTSEW